MDYEITPERAGDFLQECKGLLETEDDAYVRGLKDAIAWVLGYDGNPLEL
jgi:hypothetical protein